MRRFEYVDDKSNKFWEVSVEGTDVHLRWGRIGTDGQSKTKPFADSAKANKEAEKQIASKVKKGYAEVAAGVVAVKAPPAQPDQKKQVSSNGGSTKAASKAPKEKAQEPTASSEKQLPDETKPVLAESWRRLVLPRRGGECVPKLSLVKPTTAAKYCIEAIAKTEGEQRAPWEEAKRFFAGEEIATEIVGEAMAFARNGGKARRAFVDLLVQKVGFAKAVESILKTEKRVSSTSRYPDWGWDADYFYRLREFSATVEETEYIQARDWADERRRTIRDFGAVVLAFLFPTESDWAIEMVDIDDFRAYSLLAATLLDAQLVEQMARKQGHWSFVMNRRNLFPTIIDGLGLEAATVIGEFARADHIDTDVAKKIGTGLAALPSEEALGHLLALCDKNVHGVKGLQTFLTNFPCMSLRVLSQRDDQEKWIKFVLKSYPKAMEAVRGQLSVAQTTYLEQLATDSVEVDIAPSESCPKLLIDPPWDNRKKVKAVNVALTPISIEPAIEWKEGEQSRWRSPLTKELPDMSLKQYYATLPGWRTKNQRSMGRNLVEAPETAAHELLPNWQPEDPWYCEDYFQGVVSRFELDALGPLRHFARSSLKAAVSFFGPLADPELITLAAEAFCRLKSVRKIALNYLARHPQMVCQALLPAALGKAKKPRNYAEAALIAVSSLGHRETLLSTADEYGEEARAGLQQLLDRDPLDLLPSKMPKLPDWFDPGWVARPVLKSGGALPDEAIRNFASMLAISKPDAIYAGIPQVKQLCTDDSLAKFAWSLTELWLGVGAPSSDNWTFKALGWLGDDESARRLTPLLRKWPGEAAHARAVLGLQVLTDIGSDVALMHLYGLSQKLKFKGLKKNAGEKIEEIAENRGLTSEQLGDRLVPDLGLDEDGSMQLDYGTRQFTVGFDEQLKPYVLDGEGKRLKNLPKPGKRDNEEVAAPAFATFKALKKDVKTVGKQQLVRLERAMCLQRRWSASDFKTFFLEHPLVIHLVRRLVWGVFEEQKLVSSFRVAEDGTLADKQDEEWLFPESATIGLPHRLEMEEPEQAAWGEIFSDYELLQPFEQLGRSLYPPSDADRKTEKLTLLDGLDLEPVRVLSLESRGWRKGEAMDGGVICWMVKELPDGKVAYLHLDPGIVVGDPTAFGDLRLREVTLGDEVDTWDAPAKYPFGDLTPVGFSELVRDLETFRA